MASKSSSRVLTDHDEIRQWAEERGAKPSAVRSTHSDDDTGIIRLDFPGYSGGDSLEEIEWEEWFEDFDDRNLALVVQDETANGQTSNFNKLVSRDNVEASSERESSSKGTRKDSSQNSTRGKKTSGRSTTRQGSRTAAGKKSASGSGGGQRRKSGGTRGGTSGRSAA